MTTDTFVSLVSSELQKSPDVEDTSFLRSELRALGRKYEKQEVRVSDVVAELERLLPWQLSRDIKKGIEKALR